MPSSSPINCSLPVFVFPFQPYCTLQVLVGPSLVISEESLAFRDVWKYVCTPAVISCRFAHAVLRVFEAVRSRGWARKSCRAPLAVHAIWRVAEISADSQLPRWWCRRCVCSAFASTASMMVVVNSAAKPAVLRGWKCSQRVETTLATILSRHIMSDMNTCRLNGRWFGNLRACRLDAT